MKNRKNQNFHTMVNPLNPKNQKNENPKNQKNQKIKKSKIWKIQKFKIFTRGLIFSILKNRKNENLKNSKIQNFHTRGLTPSPENQKNENLNHAIFTAVEVIFHMLRAMESQRGIWKEAIGWSAVGLHHACSILRFMTCFFNSYPLYFNNLFSI